jgi:hypothetical protein
MVTNTLLSVPQTARTMPLVITPEIGIPLPLDVTPEEAEQFRERAKAACRTIQELIDAGAEVEITEEDNRIAHQLFANNTPVKVGRTPPGAILKLEALLNEFDHEFLGANRRITNYVTNRLLEESIDEDPRIRLKALELLGKRKGVNLFSDQIEVTLKEKPTTEIESELTLLLEKYMGNAEIVEDETPEVHASVIDLDSILGPIDA